MLRAKTHTGQQIFRAMPGSFPPDLQSVSISSLTEIEGL